MKEILPVEARKYPRIEIAWQRNFLEISAVLIAQYAEGYRYTHKYILDNQIYINALFEVADCLYNCYELSRKYLELLGSAVTHLERLYHEEIAKLSEEAAVSNIKTELAAYFDKVTMIFQTAADKTEDDRYRDFYAAMAQKYSEKADNVRGIFTASYTAKMQFLYETAAKKCEVDFIRELLQLRAEEYSSKHTGEIARASESTARFWSSKVFGTAGEHEHLLANSRVQDGLHQRKVASTFVPS